MKKRSNDPCRDLKKQYLEAYEQVIHCHFRNMCRMTKDDLITASYSLRNTREHVFAANQLGYEVVIVATEDGGLLFEYRTARPTSLPWCLR